jgi:hypothetical protein
MQAKHAFKAGGEVHLNDQAPALLPGLRLAGEGSGQREGDSWQRGAG